MAAITDTERLDFLINREAFVSRVPVNAVYHSGRYEVFTDDRGDGGEMVAHGVTARAAIDAAMGH